MASCVQGFHRCAVTRVSACLIWMCLSSSRVRYLISRLDGLYFFNHHSDFIVFDLTPALVYFHLTFFFSVLISLSISSMAPKMRPHFPLADRIDQMLDRFVPLTSRSLLGHHSSPREGARGGRLAASNGSTSRNARLPRQ